MIIGTVIGTSIQVRAQGNVEKRTASPLRFVSSEKISYQSTDGTTKEVDWTTNIADCAEGWSWDYGTKTLTLAGIDFESVNLPPDSNGKISRTRVNISFQTGQEGDEYTYVQITKESNCEYMQLRMNEGVFELWNIYWQRNLVKDGIYR